MACDKLHLVAGLKSMNTGIFDMFQTSPEIFKETEPKSSFSHKVLHHLPPLSSKNVNITFQPHKTSELIHLLDVCTRKG